MKTSPNPQRVIDNPSDFNLTQEHLNDFVKYMWEKNFMLHNKSYTTPNITNVTQDEPTSHQAGNCHEYCHSQMRRFFDEYRHYHGYVTLVVSTSNLI